MRLSYPLFETPIIFEENKVNVLVIENQKAFSDFVISLVSKSEGGDADLVLSKNFEEVKFDRISDVVTDIIMIDCNDKKIISKLYSKLNEIAFEEGNYNLTLDIVSKINEYLFSITQTLPCTVCFDENVELNMLFKSVSLRVDNDEKNILEKLCDYIELMAEFCHIELFIFVNLKAFLNNEDLKEFYKFVDYMKVRVLIVENVLRERCEFENIKIIDNDLCEIS